MFMSVVELEAFFARSLSDPLPCRCVDVALPMLPVSRTSMKEINRQCVCVCGSAHHPLDVFRWALRAEPHSRHFHAWRTLYEIICTTISHKCHRQLRFLSLRPEIIAYRRLSKLRCIFVNIRFPSCE